jgi:hypothetical protein
MPASVNFGTLGSTIDHEIFHDLITGNVHYNYCKTSNRAPQELYFSTHPPKEALLEGALSEVYGNFSGRKSQLFPNLF